MIGQRIATMGALALLAVVASAPTVAARAKPHRTPAHSSTETAAKPPAAPPRQIQPWGTTPLSAEVEATLRPKDSFKECPECPEMVVVPKGSFMMGTPANEVDRNKGEDPVHRVTLTRSFAVGRFAISFDEWDACLADGGCNGRRGDDHGFGRGRMPAHGLSYTDAQAYLAWLSKKTGRTYRLPSESEREYVTRAGTTTPFWFGKTVGPQDANYDASIPYAGGPRGERSKGPRPVDSYAPNPFGLYQVHGNVYEWTQDCYNKRYTEDTPADGAPWLEGDCSRRMVRGGEWGWSANIMRSGARNDSRADSGAGPYGFRVVRDLNALQRGKP
ncbi:formylglycine-generating enzyme family protein [Bradyrhizobium sp. 2TAF24]|uniref:formylglycine-generating enzyme family protein n=1 Tax=Bradyrhizobium sp. 2TAF24 TaxID=3233011 RepID=UPI003F93D0DF